MTNYSLSASSTFQERGGQRLNHAKAKRLNSRPRRSVNLSRLCEELGFDLVGEALGLSEQALRILVEGRDHAREEQYSAHLVHRLKDAGFPAGWIDRPNAQLAPEYLLALGKFAAGSCNKAPIRRANFRRLAAAFEGREEVLADALEIVPSSVSNVAQGRLEFDDGRFGHINPRLLRAGFPDGWLEQAEPDLTDSMLEALEQLATDEYERKFEEEEELKNMAQAFVSPTPIQVAEMSVQPAAANVDSSKETSMATANQRQAKSTPSSKPKQPSFAVPAPQPEFKAAGMPTATKPMFHPTAAGTKQLPRSVLASGRKLPGSTGASKPAPAPTPARKAAPKATSTPKAASTVVAAKAKAPAKPRTPAVSRAMAHETVERRTPRGTVTKEISLARAEALEKLLESARRGVKVTLWRDILGSSLPFWGNVRRGAVLFRDDLAEGVVQAMGLPEGWLDNPTFPPSTMAAWVTDANALIPTAMEAHAGANAGAAAAAASATAKPAAPETTMAKPFVRQSAPRLPKVTMTKPPAAPPVFSGATVAAATPATSAAAPVAAQTQLPGTGAAPAVAGQVGPLCQALLSVITQQATAGTFTEQDALTMLNSLMSTR